MFLLVCTSTLVSIFLLVGVRRLVGTLHLFQHVAITRGAYPAVDIFKNVIRQGTGLHALVMI